MLIAWYIFRFKPAKSMISSQEYRKSLTNIKQQYANLAPTESLVVDMVLNRKYSGSNYDNLQDLRNAALLRTSVTVLISVFPPLALML